MTQSNTISMLDVASPDSMELVFAPLEGRIRTLWVNIDGVCRLRIQGEAVHDAVVAMVEEAMNKHKT